MHGLLQLMEFRCKLRHKICIPVRLSLTASVTVRVIVLGKPYFPRNFAFASYMSSVFIIPEGCCQCVFLSVELDQALLSLGHCVNKGLGGSKLFLPVNTHPCLRV